ncbi:DUF2207 domain-containing protein [Kribbella speibonae]|uniref:DUF2207 domain-containing protein n=1 Tax=Kribbella speibonae TaxID=1572660 RepID=A0ABY2A9Y5_9ACTN|nr:DUF2207 domain-containing protein [Kribbella speibonae]
MRVVTLLSVVDGRVVRVVALVALGLAVAGVLVPVLREGERFYPGRTDDAQVKAQYEIRADGAVDVTETIDYEYNRSGLPLDRIVHLRRPAEGPIDQQISERGKDRVWKVTDVTATDPTGAPVPVRTKVLDPALPPMTATGIDGWDSRLSDLLIQLGEDNQPAGHRASYVLRYRVHGALDKTADGYELNWPDPVRAAENSWVDYPQVPLHEVRVLASTKVTTASCTAYTEDKQTPCATKGEPTIFTPGRVPAGMTVKVAVPAAGITDGGAEYDGSPLSLKLKILLVAAGVVLFLALVGVVASCLIRGFPLHLRRRA